ncbi:MAG: glycosyl transferase family 51, partial [Gammaproteobacteria bacterium]|nr:glycosyl transferase family 51 [Gammaproteobacteria bacterium]
HERFAGQSAQALRNTPVDPQDALTRWAIDYLASNTDHNLPAMLDAALERSYSANPQESFFTGGGVHTFGNFRREDNNRIATVKESLRESLNLPFVRIMRDIVRYTIHHEPGSSAKLLGDDSDPRRQAYLQRFADREGQVFLQRFWRKYQGKNTQERLEAFLDGLRQNPVRLSAVHRYLYPDADEASFGQFLRARLPNEQLTERRIRELYKRYGPGAFNLPDQAYVARVHPLELWLLSYLHRHPEARLRDAVEASAQQRQEVYGWLFRTRAKNARDSRIRTMLEVEAFLDIHRRWQRLGYPFGHLVPSLATALGSSGDRPAALAELMGIILNDGVRLPAVRIDHLHFAKDTPYEVELGRTPVQGEQVMHPDVAAALKGALADVVEGGTARRLQGTFKTDDGTVLTLGGKTGTGDNRIETVGAGGQRIRSRALNRTATFVFYLGDDHFGTLTAFVPGREAANFRFTSALPV